ncbi:MAG: DUF1292 domain-containing protein [Clostridia bacterium]|nr:DUF1292 domain-containing protein [Clostridia bacterium]
MDDQNFNENASDNIITLKDEETGEDIDFEFLDLIEYKGRSYVILLPPDGDEVMILQDDGLAEDEENENYATVGDQETLDAVYEIFKERFKDEFSFED